MEKECLIHSSIVTKPEEPLTCWTLFRIICEIIQQIWDCIPQPVFSNVCSNSSYIYLCIGLSQHVWTHLHARSHRSCHTGWSRQRPRCCLPDTRSRSGCAPSFERSMAELDPAESPVDDVQQRQLRQQTMMLLYTDLGPAFSFSNTSTETADWSQIRVSPKAGKATGDLSPQRSVDKSIFCTDSRFPDKSIIRKT